MKKDDNEKVMNDFMASEMRICPACLGKGKNFDEVCRRCQGTKQVSKHSKITYL